MNAPAPVAVQENRGCPPGQGVVAPEHGGQIGNPPHEPTDANRALVRTLTKFMPHEMIAEEIGVHLTTLYKYYRAELGEGKREVIKALGSKVITKAMAGDNQMIMFYLKAFAGWNEPQRHEISGPGGGAIPVAALHAFLSGKSEDELASIDQFLSALLGSAGVIVPTGLIPSGGDGSAPPSAADQAPAADGGPAG